MPCECTQNSFLADGACDCAEIPQGFPHLRADNRPSGRAWEGRDLCVCFCAVLQNPQRGHLQREVCVRRCVGSTYLHQSWQSCSIHNGLPCLPLRAVCGSQHLCQNFPHTSTGDSPACLPLINFDWPRQCLRKARFVSLVIRSNPFHGISAYL